MMREGRRGGRIVQEPAGKPICAHRLSVAVAASGDNLIISIYLNIWRNVWNSDSVTMLRDFATTAWIKMPRISCHCSSQKEKTPLCLTVGPPKFGPDHMHWVQQTKAAKNPLLQNMEVIMKRTNIQQTNLGASLKKNVYSTVSMQWKAGGVQF